MPRIPTQNRDLRLLVWRTAIARTIGFAVWVTLLILGAHSYNQNHQTYPPERQIIGWKMALWIAIAVVSGFFIFRLWKFITERPFVGTVETYKHARSYSPSPNGVFGGESDFRINTALRVRTDKGKLRRIRFEQKNGFYQYYHEGNRIAYLRGLPYPINLDPNGKDGYVCASCGAHTAEWQDTCPACNRSMIDPNEIHSS